MSQQWRSARGGKSWFVPDFPTVHPAVRVLEVEG